MWLQGDCTIWKDVLLTGNLISFLLILRELCPFDLCPELFPDYSFLDFLQVQAIFLVPKLPDPL